MRNRWGIDVRKGYYVRASDSRGGAAREGVVVSIEKTGAFARAYGPQVKLDNGTVVGLDDIGQSLGPMTIGKDGTVRQNPLTRVAIDDDSQRPHIGKSGKPTKRPTKRLIERRVKTASTTRKGVYANPLHRVKISSPSMTPPHDEPSTRLKARRRKTAASPEGFYANPREHELRYIVQYRFSMNDVWETCAAFLLLSEAKFYARRIADEYEGAYVRVINN